MSREAPKHYFKIKQLDEGDRNCAPFALIPYAHTTKLGADCIPEKTDMIPESQTTETLGGMLTWPCNKCGTILEFYLPLDSEIE